MKLALCDDDLTQLEYLEKLVLNWMESRGVHWEIFKYPAAEQLLFDYYPNRFDVLLLDIQMQGINGVALAKKVRELGDAAAVIFITALIDYVLEGYNVGAVQYLLKPVDKAKLFEALDSVCVKTKDKPKIILENEDKKQAVYRDDIIFAEAFSHKTRIVLNSGELFVGKSISQVQQLFDKDFYKCHRSYIVNIKHINEIRKYELVMDNGAVIPVSRRIYKDVNREFISYYRR